MSSWSSLLRFSAITSTALACSYLIGDFPFIFHPAIQEHNPNNTRNWTELPDHLLGLIIERLSLTDYLRFGAVCVSWNSIIKNREYRPRPRPPWLMLLTQGNNDRNAKFFNLIEERIYTIPLPPPIIGCRDLIGFSFGWLITMNTYTLAMHLLNPITRVQIPLPSLTTYPTRHTVRAYQFKAALCSPPSGGDFTVIVTCPSEHAVAIARSGDNIWTALYTPGLAIIEDVFHHNGQVCARDCFQKVVSWDHEDSPMPKTMAKNLDLPFSEYRSYLAENRTNNELFMVVYFYGSSKSDFSFFVLDKNRCEWVEEADGMKGNTLFIGHRSCLSFPNGEYPELRPNCIYYLDQNLCHAHNLRMF